jgi:predicted RNase H-like HicB family nuclease
MLTDYIRAAMARATYEILPDDGTFYGRIPGFQGVWANAKTLDACRTELEEVLGEWILLRAADHLPLPPAGKVRMRVSYRASRGKAKRVA